MAMRALAHMDRKWAFRFIIEDPDPYPRDGTKASTLMTWMVCHFGSLDFRRSTSTWRYSVSDIWINGQIKIMVQLDDPKDAAQFKLRWA